MPYFNKFFQQQLTELIAEYSRTGFNEVIEEYRRRCVTLGREVRLLGNTERTAYALDIAQDGALICRDSDGEFNVNSGEVSVRGLMDYI